MPRRSRRRHYRQRGEAPRRGADSKERKDWILQQFLQNPNLSVEGKNGAVELMKDRFDKAMAGHVLHDLRALAREMRSEARDWCLRTIQRTPNINISSTSSTRGLQKRAQEKYGAAAPSESELLKMQSEVLRSGPAVAEPLRVNVLADQIRQLQERAQRVEQESPSPPAQPVQEEPKQAEPKQAEPKEQAMPDEQNYTSENPYRGGNWNFGIKLREQRARRGWSMKELADRCDVVPSAIGVWEKNLTRPSMPSLVLLVDVIPEILDATLPEGKVPHMVAGQAVRDAIPNQTKFAESLRKHRVSARISRKEAAELFGIKLSTYTKWECSQAYPGKPTLQQILTLWGDLEGHHLRGWVEEQARMSQPVPTPSPAPAPAPAPVNGDHATPPPRSGMDLEARLADVSRRLANRGATEAALRERVDQTARAVDGARARYDKLREQLEGAEAALAELQSAHQDAVKALESTKERDANLREELLAIASQLG